MSNYQGITVGGIDNDDDSQEFERHHNFLVFGNLKERGTAEQVYSSVLAYGGTDIGQQESGGFGAYPPKVFGPFMVPNQIRNNTIILLPGTETYHSCDWVNDTFGNRLYGESAMIRGTGCCSNCNVTCCKTNCTKLCVAATFTLAQWEARNPVENDAATTLNTTMPTASWIVEQARALLGLHLRSRTE